MLLAEVAQVAPSIDAFKVFTNQGVMGAFIVLLVLAVIFLFRALMKEWSSRLEDSKEYSASLLKSAEANWKLTESHTRLSTSSDKLVESVSKLMTTIESRKL